MTGSHLSIVSTAVVKTNSCSQNTGDVIALEQRRQRSIASRDSIHCLPNEMSNWLCSYYTKAWEFNLREPLTVEEISQYKTDWPGTALMAFGSLQDEVDHLCVLVARVPGYRSRGPSSIPGVPDILRSSWSGTGSTQPREYNWGATWKKV
jgi:hypothetical protein